mgnify:CR=1 FL=1
MPVESPVARPNCVRYPVSIDAGANETRRVLIVGCEHSGTRWIAHLLSLHPDVTAEHASSPSAGKLPLETIEGRLARGDFDGLAIVFRDASAIRAAQMVSGSFDEVKRRAAKSPCDPEFALLHADIVETWKATADYLHNLCRRYSVASCAVSYETTLQSRRVSLSQTFCLLQISPSAYSYYDQEHADRSVAVPWDAQVGTTAVDGNEKYVVLPSVRHASRRLIHELTRLLQRHLPKSVRVPLRNIKNRYSYSHPPPR